MKKILVFAMACIMLAMTGCGTVASAVATEEATSVVEAIETVSEDIPKTAVSIADKESAHEEAKAESVEETVEEVHKHHFVNGVCECGYAADLPIDPLGAEWFSECDHAGTVEEYSFKATLAANPEKHRNSYSEIYVPYGYDPEQQYNVLVLVDGSWQYEKPGWFFKAWIAGVGPTYGSRFFDNLFDSGLAEPCIVCTAFQRYDTVGSTPEQLEYEIKNYILPYVVENYSTYAKDSSYESLCAARDHFAMGGLSNNSQYVFRAGLMRSADVFANFIGLSGTHATEEAAAALHEAEMNGDPLNFFFYSVGTYESRYGSDKNSFQILVDGVDALVDGETAVFSPVTGGHEWSTWFTAMYKALQLMPW